MINPKLQKKAEMVEKEMITLLIGYPEYTARVVSMLPIADFYHYATEYELICKANVDNKNPLAVLIQNGIETSKFVNPTYRTTYSIAEDIKECAAAWRLTSVITNASENLPIDDSHGYASKLQQEVLGAIADRNRPDSSIEPTIEEFKSIRAERKKNPKALLGESTGNPKLDEVTDGIRKGHLWVIGGYTSAGKTYGSLNIASEFVKKGKRVVYFSLEMAKVDILTRLLSVLTKRSTWSVARGLEGSEEDVDSKAELLSKSRIAIHSGIGELDEILFAMYEENLRDPVDLFVVDFIQLITKSKAKSEYETVTAAALELQLMAKKLNVPIIALSQVSNENAKDSDSAVLGFKGSGAIAAAADVAIMLVPIKEESKEMVIEKLKKGLPTSVEWKVAKNRHGRTGTILMNFHGRMGVFELSEFETLGQ